MYRKFRQEVCNWAVIVSLRILYYTILNVCRWERKANAKTRLMPAMKSRSAWFCQLCTSTTCIIWLPTSSSQSAARRASRPPSNKRSLRKRTWRQSRREAGRPLTPPQQCSSLSCCSVAMRSAHRLVRSLVPPLLDSSLCNPHTLFDIQWALRQEASTWWTCSTSWASTRLSSGTTNSVHFCIMWIILRGNPTFRISDTLLMDVDHQMTNKVGLLIVENCLYYQETSVISINNVNIKFDRDCVSRE